MCFYRGTVYECKHSEFGKKVSDCKDKRDFLAGTDEKKIACNKRYIHSMNRIRATTKCKKCQHLDALKTRTRKTFTTLRENLEKRSAAAGKSDKKGSMTDDVSKSAFSFGASEDDTLSKRQYAFGETVDEASKDAPASNACPGDIPSRNPDASSKSADVVSRQVPYSGTCEDAGSLGE